MSYVVLCWPDLVQKPRLGPGLRGLRLSKFLGQAKALSNGQLQLGLAKASAFEQLWL
jgi:hypothetical protein